MDTNTLIAIVVASVAVVLVAVIFVVYRKRRSQHLKEHFGPEYDRAVLQRGNPAKAEAELINREKRVHGFSIKALPQKHAIGMRQTGLRCNTVSSTILPQPLLKPICS